MCASCFSTPSLGTSEYSSGVPWTPPKKFLVFTSHSLATLLSGRGKLREPHLGACSASESPCLLQANTPAASLAGSDPKERWPRVCQVTLWLLPLLTHYCQEGSLDSTAREGATKSLLGGTAAWPPSLQTVDTFSVGVGWQIQLVLLFQSRWHKATP